MNSFFKKFCFAMLGITTLFLVDAFAAKPESVKTLSNGFPSGDHYNLNVIGKKSSFTCPSAEYDEYGNQVFGNVIYVPRDPAEEITIHMQSGSGKGKKTTYAEELRVTNWCSETFSSDNSPAIVEIPKNGEGYAVYARVAGKPSDETNFKITGTGLHSVQDDDGNDLLLLGLVDSDGVWKPANSDDGALYRVNNTKPGKGVNKATDISELFSYQGTVCYLTTDTDILKQYCGELYEDCISTFYCTEDSDGDGVVDQYVPPLVDLDGMYCPEGETLVPLPCRDYDIDWVFNIAEFVDYYWDVTNDKSYLVQIRFYPN